MCEQSLYSSTPFARSEVQDFISQLDSIISWMSSYSANAKNWLMTILPTGLFMLIDMFYLGKEGHFKDLQKAFIDEVRIVYKDLGLYIPPITKCQQACNTLRTIDSLSICPFYLIDVGCIILVNYLF